LRKKKWIKEEWTSYRVKEGENINSIAKKFGVSWKLIVKANKLKPPYELKSGQKIKTPPSRE